MSYWRDKRVVVTGGSGFLGSVVVAQLRRQGCRTIILVPRSRDYDLVDIGAVRRMYADTTPDLVLHLAARVGGIGANQTHAGRFFYDNLMMGTQLIEVGRQRGLEKLVAVGTICSYPKHTPVPFREEDLWAGYPEETNAPYGLAKKMMLVQAQAYRQQYGFNAVVLFPVNLYGPGDNFDMETSHVIPALIRKCVEAKERGDDRVVLWGDGSPSREFLHVDDAARAIVLAAEHYNGSEPVNVGTGHEITIQTLAELIAEAVGFSGRIVWDASKPNGQPRRCLEVSRAKRLFGFEASVAFVDGIRQTVSWFQANRRSIREVVF
ncbi:MAG: GDP-L-fucose synthase [Nitrospira sp.]|uniref:GDP-L-fucose synthase n=1 Tax=Nitrospira defluvii TaxID=330214 RepID=A0ABN7LVT9_9BACT|nr:GDP-L-fucose synthase [Nitrospira defluvii]MCS6325898.1 GDP-L-fucose synthase [Nitrospira sp.]CAE6767010.1 GDP-L-fucose synthase [Nitrospira defluvii]